MAAHTHTHHLENDQHDEHEHSHGGPALYRRILATLLVSGRFGLRISQRLGQLAENARRMANGESVLPLLGSDEFADLDVVYQTMTRQIVRQQQLNSRLQNMLLPQQLPAFDGNRIDTAYVPAAHDTDVGGDWYDAFPIGQRRI